MIGLFTPQATRLVTNCAGTLKIDLAPVAMSIVSLLTTSFSERYPNVTPTVLSRNLTQIGGLSLVRCESRAATELTVSRNVLLSKMSPCKLNALSQQELAQRISRKDSAKLVSPATFRSDVASNERLSSVQLTMLYPPFCRIAPFSGAPSCRVLVKLMRCWRLRYTSVGKGVPDMTSIRPPSNSKTLADQIYNLGACVIRPLNHGLKVC